MLKAAANWRSGLIPIAVGPLARAANQLVALGFTLLAVRYLSPTEFGIFALAAIFVTIIRTLLYTGPFEYLLKSQSADSCSTEALICNILLVTALSLIVGLVAGAMIYLGWTVEIAVFLLLLLPSNFVAAVGAWQEALLLRAGKLTNYYLLTFAAELLSAMIAAALLWRGSGIYALMFQVYSRNIFILLFYLRLNRPEFSEAFRWREVGSAIGWSLPRYGSSALGIGSTYATDLILGLMISPTATGVYRASNRVVSSITDIVNQPTRMITMTVLSKRTSEGRRSNNLWPPIFLFAAIFGWPALTVVSLTSDVLVPMIMGSEWSSAAPIVSVLCLARAFSLLDTSITPALVVADRQATILFIQAAMASLLISGLVMFSAEGVFIASIVIFCVGLLTSLFYLLVAFKDLATSPAWACRCLILAGVPPLATASGMLWLPKLFASPDGSQAQGLPILLISGVVGWGFVVVILSPLLIRVARELKFEMNAER